MGIMSGEVLPLRTLLHVSFIKKKKNLKSKLACVQETCFYKLLYGLLVSGITFECAATPSTVHL
jgi:hypothetical protein